MHTLISQGYGTWKEKGYGILSSSVGVLIRVPSGLTFLHELPFWMQSFLKDDVGSPCVSLQPLRRLNKQKN